MDNLMVNLQVTILRPLMHDANHVNPESARTDRDHAKCRIIKPVARIELK